MIGLLLRILYPLIGALENSDSWNPRNGGTLSAKIVLSVVPEFAIVLVLGVAGAYTRGMPGKAPFQQVPGHQANDESVRLVRVRKHLKEGSGST